MRTLAPLMVLFLPSVALADVAPSCKCDASAGMVAPSLGAVIVVGLCLAAVALMRRSRVARAVEAPR
ncbi:MAG: hypothetical protein H6747_06550 [Deltaproteobacteria bacterium]|nr:hypothetical protein [Deltaproteobacteria bacterium]